MIKIIKKKDNSCLNINTYESKILADIKSYYYRENVEIALTQDILYPLMKENPLKEMSEGMTNQLVNLSELLKMGYVFIVLETTKDIDTAFYNVFKNIDEAIQCYLGEEYDVKG